MNGYVVDKFPVMIRKLSELLTRFLDNLQCADMAWISEGQLDALPSPSIVGRTRVGGIDINRPRMRAAMEAVLALALAPSGFTAAAHARKVHELVGPNAGAYSPRQAAYDLKKLRGKGLVERAGRTSRHYRPTREGLRTIAGLVVLREKVLKPLLTYNGRCKPGSKTQVTAQIDAQYQVVQRQMQHLFKALHLVA